MAGTSGQQRPGHCSLTVLCELGLGILGHVSEFQLDPKSTGNSVKSFNAEPDKSSIHLHKAAQRDR